MIITERSDFKRYLNLNPHFATVNDFIETNDLASLPEGITKIDGDKVFANCMTYVADGIAGEQFETHQKYLDIHLLVNNTEVIAVAPLSKSVETAAYDDDDDFSLHHSEDYQLVTLTESNLLVVFEEDIHQPKIKVNDHPVKKIVFKVLNQSSVDE